MQDPDQDPAEPFLVIGYEHPVTDRCGSSRLPGRDFSRRDHGHPARSAVIGVRPRHKYRTNGCIDE
jgi:hypothetical protein